MLTDPNQPEKSGVAGVVIVTLVLAALAWLSLQPNRLPAPLSSDAPGGLFSAGRALPDFMFLAQAPRPIASEANARARRYIVERLRAVQYAPEVQTASAQKTAFTSLGFNHKYHVTLGVANNVLVRIKGTARDRESRPALLVASHYDSAPDQLGAADASSSVAAMIETLRALRSGAPPQNDVIFLFADGEKAGSLGVRAFAEQHPWARKVGLVLQFDAAGNSGPLLLTGTRGGDGNAVAAWANAAPLAQGNSTLPVLARLTGGLQEAGPIDHIGAAQLRFANIEGSTGYSGGLDLPGRLAHGTLQHAGDTMLALVRHFGAVPLADVASADRVHFDLPVVGQVHYSTAHVWAITRLASFIFVVVCCAAVKQSGMELRMLGAGSLVFLVIAGGMATAAVTLWQNIPGLREAYNPMAGGAGARDVWYLLAYLSLGIALFIEAQRRLHKAIGLPATVLGALFLLLLLLATASYFLPGATYLLAWPLMGALLAYGALFVPSVAALPRAARLAILAAGMAPAVILFAPLIRQMVTLFTPQRSALLMLTLAAMLGLGGALLAAVRRRFIAPILLAVCAGALHTASNTVQYDAPTARANRMTYLKDTYSWKAWWLMPAEPLDDWSRPFFADTSGPREVREVFGMGQEEIWVAPAPRSKVEFPEVVALKDEEVDGRRKIAFSMRSKNNAPTVTVRVEDAYTLEARLDGKVLTDKRAKQWSMTLHGMGGREHLVELDLSRGSIARVYINERIPGLPAEAGAPRPGHTPLTGMTIASDMLVFR